MVMPIVPLFPERRNEAYRVIRYGLVQSVLTLLLIQDPTEPVHSLAQSIPILCQHSVFG